MSDFLSQFENRVEQPRAEQPGVARPVAPPAGLGGGGTQPVAPPLAERPVALSAEFDERGAEPALIQPSLQASSPSPAPSSDGGIQAVEHRVEVDPDYRRSKLRRRIILVVAVVAVVAIAALAWQLSRLVEVPELMGKPLSEAQAFSRDKGVELEVVEEFRVDADKGLILSQGVEAGKTITKGSVLQLTVSKGPDPSEHLVLPDFSSMERPAAERWIAQERADNLRIVVEFSDTVDKDGFLRLEFRSNDVNAENYRRSDYATLYYSKGAEVFEKTITVPDFSKKTRADVESWATTNGIALTVAETDSDTIQAGFIISQSVSAGEKLAKNDEFAITVSLGKALVVPNFANYTAETAAGAAGEIPVSIETRFSAGVAYGQLISQSMASGTRLLPDDVKTVRVVYSEGQPYLKDYRGESEGTIPSTIFRDYTSKGANVTYEIRYVDSSEPKGSIVGMSDYSRFIPLNFHVAFEVSRGNLTPPVPPPSTPSP